MQSIQAGYIQFAPLFGMEEKNMAVIDSLLDFGRDADIVIIPELPNTGYVFNSRSEAWNYASTVNESPYITFLLEKARSANQFIVSGFCEKENDKLYNSSILIGPGKIIGKYRKLHLFMDEKEIFEPGNLGMPVFNTEIGRIAMLICFDWAFPEAWRIMGLKGAQLVCHPSNLVLPHAQNAVPVHSLINRYFTITANRFGEERGIHFSGKSIISSPDGKIISAAGKNDAITRTITIDLSLSENKNLTPKNHAYDDRRPELYQDICNLKK